MNLIELEPCDIELNIQILSWPRKMIPVFKKCNRVSNLYKQFLLTISVLV